MTGDRGRETDNYDRRQVTENRWKEMVNRQLSGHRHNPCSLYLSQTIRLMTFERLSISRINDVLVIVKPRFSLKKHNYSVQ